MGDYECEEIPSRRLRALGTLECEMTDLYKYNIFNP